jgi:hypothetical protein
VVASRRLEVVSPVGGDSTIAPIDYTRELVDASLPARHITLAPLLDREMFIAGEADGADEEGELDRAGR